MISNTTTDEIASSADLSLSNSGDRKMVTSSGEDALYELLFGAELTVSSQEGASNRPSSDEAFQYLQELNSFHLDRLNAEPFMLRDKQAHCSDEIKSLAFSNYKTFVRTAQCSREIYADFARIDEHLDQVNTRLPAFSQACDSFTKSIQVEISNILILTD